MSGRDPQKFSSPPSGQTNDDWQLQDVEVESGDPIPIGDIGPDDAPRRVKGSRPEHGLIRTKEARFILTLVACAIMFVVLILAFVGWYQGRGLDFLTAVWPVTTALVVAAFTYYFAKDK
jgi:hypothetical protein